MIAPCCVRPSSVLPRIGRRFVDSVHSRRRASTSTDGASDWLLRALACEAHDDGRAPRCRPLDSSDRVFEIEGALAPSQCRAIVSAAEAAGFEAAGIDPRASRSTDEGSVSVMRTDVRLNQRIILDSADAAGALFNRLAPVFPRTFHKMALDSFSERIRLYKYSPGDFFAPHVDGAFTDEQRGTTFVYTVLLYLNDVERGGRTTFFKARVVDGAIEYRPTPSPPPVAGREGRGLAFFHKTPHSGEAVEEGLKYVLRLDAMYRPRVPSYAHSSSN